jgi:hypothetical protein
VFHGSFQLLALFLLHGKSYFPPEPPNAIMFIVSYDRYNNKPSTMAGGWRYSLWSLRSSVQRQKKIEYIKKRKKKK